VLPRSAASPFTLASGFLSSCAISPESAVSSSARSEWARKDSCCAAAVRCTMRSNDQRTARPAPAANAKTKVSTVACVTSHAVGTGSVGPPPNAETLKSGSAAEAPIAAKPQAAPIWASARTALSGHGTKTPEMSARGTEM